MAKARGRAADVALVVQNRTLRLVVITTSREPIPDADFAPPRRLIPEPLVVRVIILVIALALFALHVRGEQRAKADRTIVEHARALEPPLESFRGEAVGLAKFLEPDKPGISLLSPPIYTSQPVPVTHRSTHAPSTNTCTHGNT